MLAIILYLFRFVRLLFSGHQAVAVENLGLAIFSRRQCPPPLKCGAINFS